MTTTTIDLNADAGEAPAALEDGREEALVRCVTSVNAACSGHAGDAQTLDRLASLCAQHDTAFNAHPSYPDPEHFGRRTLDIDDDTLEGSLREQLALARHAAQTHGLTLSRVKPHGALYHDAARHPARAHALARALDGPTEIVLPPSPATSAVFTGAGHTLIAEGFADRAYTASGELMPRSSPGAIITEPEAAAAQSVELALSGMYRTLCVHADTPNALAIAMRVREKLEDACIRVAR